MTKAGPYDGVTSSEGSIERAMEAGGGVLRLAPAWVHVMWITFWVSSKLTPLA